MHFVIKRHLQFPPLYRQNVFSQFLQPCTTGCVLLPDGMHDVNGTDARFDGRHLSANREPGQHQLSEPLFALAILHYAIYCCAWFSRLQAHRKPDSPRTLNPNLQATLVWKCVGFKPQDRRPGIHLPDLQDHFHFPDLPADRAAAHADHCCIMTKTRQSIRKRYGLAQLPCHDCCVTWCCECCALLQEGRELRKQNAYPGLVSSTKKEENIGGWPAAGLPAEPSQPTDAASPQPTNRMD
jgi:Cys-rich protein (TIGR01571 family)